MILDNLLYDKMKDFIETNEEGFICFPTYESHQEYLRNEWSEILSMASDLHIKEKQL